MTLQFKPQMYLNAKGKPAGYDVVLLKRARQADGRQARHQEPRLQRPDPGPRLEEVRHGLGRPLGHARAQEGDRLQPAVRPVRPDPRGRRRATRRPRRSRRGTAPTRRSPRCRARPRSSSCRRRSRTPSRSRSRTRTRRSSRSRPAGPTASWSRTTCSRSSTSRTANKLEAGRVHEAAARRVRLVRRAEGQRRARGVPEQVHLRASRRAGMLAKIYKATIGAPLPPMPRLPLNTARWTGGEGRRPPSARSNSMAAEPTTSSSSAAGPPGSRPLPRRPRPGSRSASSTSGRRSAARSSSSRARAFASRDPTALGRDYLRGRELIDAAERSGARLLLADERGRDPRARRSCSSRRASARARVAAAACCSRPGAHDRPVVFPGWTLPGVITAGGAQTLVKTQRVLPGKRIVFAGSGPLALAFPAQLRGLRRERRRRARGRARARRRATSLRLARAPRAATRRCSATPSRYRAALLRARVPAALPADRRARRGRRPGRAGRPRRRRRRLASGRRHARRRIAADTLCLGYGFFPSVELLRLAGCDFAYDEDLGGPVVVRRRVAAHDGAGVSAAGDGTGVAGSYVAIDEGRLAALGAALDLGALAPADAAERAAPLRRAACGRSSASARRCAGCTASARGSTSSPTPETVVCRCEEVTRRASSTRRSRPRPTSTSSRR